MMAIAWPGSMRSNGRLSLSANIWKATSMPTAKAGSVGTPPDAGWSTT